MTFRESTAPVLRQDQIDAMQNEVRSLESMANAPPHIASSIQNKGQIIRHLRSIEKDLETQAPKPYSAVELDLAVERERELRDQWTAGMPTQAEMRRAPAGAVDKHRAWESRSKESILEWKRIRRRLLASGCFDGEYGRDARDIANIERYRPNGGPGEMPMHNEMIQGKSFFMPSPGAGPAAVMSDAESAALRMISPELHSKMALLDNEQRGEVLAYVRQLLEPKGKSEAMTGADLNAAAGKATKAKPKKKPRKKRVYTAEEKQQINERMAALRARRTKGRVSAEPNLANELPKP